MFGYMDAFAAQALGLFTTLHRGAQTNNERAHCGLNTRNTPHTHTHNDETLLHIYIYIFSEKHRDHRRGSSDGDSGTSS